MMAAFLSALVVPVGASSAQADGCSSPQTYTFIVAMPGGQIGTIRTQECFSGGTSTGTFLVTVGNQTVGGGTLTALHSGCLFSANFEGKTDREFTGWVDFHCGSGNATVEFKGFGLLNQGFICAQDGDTNRCAPDGAPMIVPTLVPGVPSTEFFGGIELGYEASILFDGEMAQATMWIADLGMVIVDYFCTRTAGGYSCTPIGQPEVTLAKDF
jgi:hypothetical protein